MSRHSGAERTVARRPPGNPLVTGRAVPRAGSPVVSAPIAIHGSRTRFVRNFGLGHGRYRRFGHHPSLAGYRVPRIYGTYFYYAGYSTFGLGFGVGSPYYYPRYSYYPYYPYYSYGHYGHRGYGQPGYGYGYGGGYATGELRLKVRPRHAQVFVDGYFVGNVDSFDGVFQSLRLEEGAYQIEIRAPGYEPLILDVRILPGEKIVYEGVLAPVP